MLVTDPSNRLTIQQVLQHRWFNTWLGFKRYGENLNLENILKNLIEYQSPERLQAESKKVIIANMVSDKLRDYSNAFYSIDAEHSGYITIENLK